MFGILKGSLLKAVHHKRAFAVHLLNNGYLMHHLDWWARSKCWMPQRSTPSSPQLWVCRLVSWHFMSEMICLCIWDEQLQTTEYDSANLLCWEFSATTAYPNKLFQRTLDCFVCVFVKFAQVYSCSSSRSCCGSFVRRYTEQPSSSMSRTLRRTCRSVSAHSSACQVLIWDLRGPEVFTATRASVCSPTGPSSSPSGASSLSSTDAPSLDHMLYLLKS